MPVTINPELKPLPTYDAESGYTPEAYPHFVGCDNSNWQIYANDAGRFASLAIKPTCKSTHFGDLRHMRHIIGDYRRPYTLTPKGAELIGQDFLNYVNSLQ